MTFVEAKPSSIHQKLLYYSSRQSPGVEVIPSLGPRKDNLQIFDEADAFTGTEKIGAAQSGAFIPASAHTRARIPADEITSAVERVFNHVPVFLHPSLRHISEHNELFPPHLTVAWNDNMQINDTVHRRCELGDIPKLQMQERQDVVLCASTQLARCAIVLHEVTGEIPTMYGLFGRATQQEREKSCLGAGAPSVELGHAHLAVFETSVPLADRDPTLQELIKINDPWSEVILERLGASAVTVVEHALANHQPAVLSHVRLLSESTAFNHAQDLNGIHITFEPISLATAFDMLAGVVGAYDSFYADMRQGYEDLHRFGRTATIHEAMKTTGCSYEQIEEAMSLLSHIRPTSRQLTSWIASSQEQESSQDKTDKLIQLQQRYQRISARFTNREVSTLSTTLLQETIDSGISNSQSIFHTKASGAYEIEYNIKNAEIHATGIRLFMKATTNNGIPEEKNSRILSRY